MKKIYIISLIIFLGSIATFTKVSLFADESIKITTWTGTFIDFETDKNWYGGDYVGYNWTRNTNEAFSWEYSISPNNTWYNWNPSTCLTKEIILSDSQVWVSFYLKTDIEETSSWVFFAFYTSKIFDYNIDIPNNATLIQSWTGVTDWTNYEFPLDFGYNVLKWCNFRDYQNSFVTNNVWLDDISIIESFTNTWTISWSENTSWNENISWNRNTSWSGSTDLWNENLATTDSIDDNHTNSWNTINDNWNTKDNSWEIITWSATFPNYATTLDPSNPLLGIIINESDSENTSINQWDIGSGILILPNDVSIENTDSWSINDTETNLNTSSWNIENIDLTLIWEMQWDNNENTDNSQENISPWSQDIIYNETSEEITEIDDTTTIDPFNNITTNEPSINKSPSLIVLPDDHPIISENSNINNYSTDIVGVGSWIFIAPSNSTIIADNIDENWNFVLPPDTPIVKVNIWNWAIFNPCNRIKINSPIDNNNSHTDIKEYEYYDDYAWISEATKIKTWAETEILILFSMITWVIVMFLKRIPIIKLIYDIEDGFKGHLDWIEEKIKEINI